MNTDAQLHSKTKGEIEREGFELRAKLHPNYQASCPALNPRGSVCSMFEGTCPKTQNRSSWFREPESESRSLALKPMTVISDAASLEV